MANVGLLAAGRLRRGNSVSLKVLSLMFALAGKHPPRIQTILNPFLGLMLSA